MENKSSAFDFKSRFIRAKYSYWIVQPLNEQAAKAYGGSLSDCFQYEWKEYKKFLRWARNNRFSVEES